MKQLIYIQNEQTQFKSKITYEIKDYLIAKIREREAMSKGFGKYTGAFDYFDKTLIALSATSGGISIASSCHYY